MKLNKLSKAIILITLFLLGINMDINQASSWGEEIRDNWYYQNMVILEKYDQCFIPYLFKWKVYWFPVPFYKQELIKLENDYHTWLLSEDNFYYKVLYINSLLIKNWYEPIYY